MQNESQEQIQQVYEGTKLAGSIYISNFAAAINLKTLHTYKIVAVISVGRGLLLSHSKQILSNYLYIPVEDSENQKIKQHFGMTYDFIQKNRKRGNILVHCYMGRSRSATIIAAYLICKYNYTMPQAVQHLRRKHKKVNPNKGFLCQLEDYRRELSNIHQKLGFPTQISRIKDTLAKGLNDLKQRNEIIQKQIEKANESLKAMSKQKRPKSEYLKKRLQQCLTEKRSRQNSCLGSSIKKSSAFDFEHVVKKLHGVS